MSGPCTLEYLLLKSALLGAQAVLESGQAIYTGIGEARDAAQRAADARLLEARQLREAARDALRRLAARATELEAALERMQGIAAAVGSETIAIDVPARPELASEQDLARYAGALETALIAAQAQLSQAADRLARTHDASLDAERLARLANPASLGELLDAYLAGNRAAEQSAEHAARRARIEAIIAPLVSGAAAQPLPADIGVLLAELAAPGETARAAAVELELKRLVTLERQRRERVARDAERARSLLAELDAQEADDVATNAMRQRLELAAQGLVDFAPTLENEARSLLAALEAASAEAVRKAAAQVLERSLADLGFNVEPIAHTLFMSGGVAHFSRPEWGEYAVRLRASPADGTLNFNVVREPDAAPSDPLSAHLRDARAEETWCEHIPKLTETLAARGIRLAVKRRLGAGEAPVQVVPQGTLDALPKPTTQAQAQPQRREIS